MTTIVRGGMLVLAVPAGIAMLTGSYVDWSMAVGGWLSEHVMPVWLGFWNWLVFDLLGLFPGVPRP